MLGEAIDNGLEVEGGLADPAGQSRAVELDALAAVDLRLAIQWKVVGELPDQDMGEGRLGRQATFDQMGRRWCLMHTFLACRAGVFRADGGDHPELRGDDVEALGDVLADPNHGTTAARAGQARGLDDPLEPRQLLRQPAQIAPRRRSRWRVRRRGLSGRSRLRLFDFGHSGLEVLEGQLPGIGIELLGSLAVKRLAELPDQMLEALVLLGERPDLGFEPCPRHPLGTQRRLLCRESRLVGGRQSRQIEVLVSTEHGRSLAAARLSGACRGPSRVTLPQPVCGFSPRAPAASRAPRTTPRTALSTAASRRHEWLARQSGRLPVACRS